MADVYSWLGRKMFAKKGWRDPLKAPRAVERFRADLREWLQREVAGDVDRLDQAHEEAHQMEVLRKGARAGWLTLLVPTRYGGEFRLMDFFRHGLLKGVVFTEELAAACSGVAVLYGAHTLGLLPLFLSFDPKILKKFLPEVAKSCRGERPGLFAFAITEPSAGSDVEDPEGSKGARLTTFARRKDGGYVLNGRKCFISGGNLAEFVTVFAALDKARGVESWTAFVVRRGTPGFSVGRIEDKMGQRASPAAELIFEDVFVPDDHRVGPEGDGWRLNQQTLDLSRPGVGAIALGAARSAFEKTLAWARGQGHLSDRLWQHELGDIAMKLEAGRTLVWRAAVTFPPDPALSAMSKCFASDVAMEACSRLIDLTAPFGAARPFGLEKAYRDVKLTQIYEGTNQIQRLKIAEPWLADGGGASA
ncbi:MAG: acyl-CoA dehydrogenase family protein [Nitrospirae bacterium]|nr:acyl-CoA dehydrogenase family protein [Nitrospirota bacterium]